MKTIPDSRQGTQVCNPCSLMHSECVYPITALIRPQRFPSDVIEVLHPTVMGSVLTVSTDHFTQQQHVFMLSYRPIREAQEVPHSTVLSGSVLVRNVPGFSFSLVLGINTTLPMSLGSCCHGDSMESYSMSSAVSGDVTMRQTGDDRK